MGARHSSAILAALAARASALPMPPPPAARLRLARALTTMSAAGGERKANLYGLRDEQLEAVLKDWGQPKFRLKQIRDCLYGDAPAADIDAMHTLPKALRARLREHATLGELGVEFEQQSKDGTQKRLWRCHDGSLIESVLMPYDDRRSAACISSQSRSVVPLLEAARFLLQAHRVHLVAGGLRDGLHLLRDRADGLPARPQRGGDLRAGRALLLRDYPRLPEIARDLRAGRALLLRAARGNLINYLRAGRALLLRAARAGRAAEQRRLHGHGRAVPQLRRRRRRSAAHHGRARESAR